MINKQSLAFNSYIRLRICFVFGFKIRLKFTVCIPLFYKAVVQVFFWDALVPYDVEVLIRIDKIKSRLKVRL